MRLVFTDERLHRLCAEPGSAAAFWGASWGALRVCLGLLFFSLDFGHLRAWRVLDIRVDSGRIHVAHADAVVSLVPVADDGTSVELHEGEAVTTLDKIQEARVVDVVCASKVASARRGR
jgi:hypothetical protein